MSQPQPKKGFSNAQTLVFIIVLSFICALILSALASALAQPKETAKDLDRSKQMMIAAKILTHQGYFQLPDEKGGYQPAKYVKEGILEPSKEKVAATNAQLLDIYRKRLIPMFIDDKGDLISLDKSGVNLADYLNEHRKTGYYRQPLKLIYQILPNPPEEGKGGASAEPLGYVIPVNGYGLWDAIYGYLAVKTDGTTVIGISWYDQKETPGLGANIAEEDWQRQFQGKSLFQADASGQIDLKTAPLGITVVRGAVADVLGNAPKAKSAVDGMAGATLTGNGVTDAYRDVLAAYRPFLVKLQREKEHER